MAKKIAILILTLILSLTLFACAKEPEKVKVTFVGWEDEVINTQEIELGNTVVFPANPDVDGYEFIGWFLANNEPIHEVLRGYYKPAKSITVYAHFRELNTHIVKFYDQNGTVIKNVKVREDQVLDYESNLPTPIVPADKLFTGWYIKGTNTLANAEYFAQNPVLGDVQIEARFRDKIKYTVTLMNGEVEHGKINVIEGDEFNFSVQNPEKENYTFDGWYFDAENTDMPYDGSRPDADITLYAHFSEIPLFEVLKNEADLTCTIRGLNEYYLEKTDTLVIPESISINGTAYTVVGIANDAFKGNEKLTSVTLSTTVESIGNSAFANCTALTEITLSQSLTTISASAFQDCTALATLTIPASVTAVGASAFKGCSALKTATFPKTLAKEKIATDAMEGTAITSLTAPVWVVALVDTAKLKTVTLTAGESIPEKLFKNAKSLEVLTLPAELKAIEAEAFAGALCLKEIEIPASVTSIATGAFAACSALEAITVAEGNEVYTSNDSNCIVEIATKTLLVACQNTTVYEGIEEIAEGAFFGCVKLTKLNIPASVTTIPEGFLAGCILLENLTVAPENEAYISINNCLIRLSDLCLIQGCKASVLPEEFKVGEQTKTISSISAKAFAGCTTLVQINIPASITTIKENTFKGCTALAKITVTNPDTVIEDNAFDGCTSISDITLPYTLVKTFITLSKQTLKNVTLLSADKVEKELFAGCAALETVTLPKTVTVIELGAFEGCTKLHTVVLAQGSELETIEMNAFKGCSSLVAFAVENDSSEHPFLLPLSVKEIGEYAFAGCGMKALLFENGASISTIGYKAFADCSSLAEINIPRNASTVDYDAFSGCTALTKASLGADIMRCLLVAASNITELNITSGDALDYETIRALTALESISLSKNITAIDARSLRTCTKLVNITIDALNTALKVENDYVIELATGTLVFAAAKSEITISKNVKTIGAYAFVGTGIEKIVIPATVEKIENFAFSACRSLKSLEILGEPEIEALAFEGCDAIETVKAYESAFVYLNQVTIQTKDIIPSADDGDEPNGDEPNGDEPNGDEPNGDEPNGNEPNGDEPNGDEPNGDEPNGDEPNGDEPNA